jgi:hypothetical protein
MDVDFDQLLKAEGVLERLQAVGSAEEARRILNDVPGIKMNPDREITIEFTPKT